MYINIRLKMITNNITFDDIAKCLNVSRNTASHKVNGKANMSVKDIKQLQTTLFNDLSLEELMETKQVV